MQRRGRIIDLEDPPPPISVRRGGGVEDRGGIGPDVAARRQAGVGAAACDRGVDLAFQDQAQAVRAGGDQEGALSAGKSSRWMRRVTIPAITAKGGATWSMPCLTVHGP